MRCAGPMLITTTVHIESSADAVWELIGPGFAEVGAWVTAIPASTATGPSRPDGAPCEGRVCSVAASGFDTITEELTAYDAHRRSLTYRATRGMPSAVRQANNTWQVHQETTTSCRFTMTAEVTFSSAGRLLAPALVAYLRMIGRQTARDLKVYAESGEPSASKRAATGPLGRTRSLLALNAAFSTATGLALLAVPDYWARELAAPAALVVALGLGLGGWAAGLMWLRHRGPEASWVRAVALADLAWVLGTAALLAARWQTFGTAALGVILATSAVVSWLGRAQWTAAKSGTLGHTQQA